jgi:hypothetical protein
MDPPLPPGFQISAVSSISTDHAASSEVVLLATHQQADDVMMALLKEVHFLFAKCLDFSLLTTFSSLSQHLHLA